MLTSEIPVTLTLPETGTGFVLSLTTVTSLGFGSRFGFGLTRNRINANLDIFIDKGYIVAVLSNYDRSASPVAEKISELLARVK